MVNGYAICNILQVFFLGMCNGYNGTYISAKLFLKSAKFFLERGSVQDVIIVCNGDYSEPIGSWCWFKQGAGTYIIELSVLLDSMVNTYNQNMQSKG